MAGISMRINGWFYSVWMLLVMSALTNSAFAQTAPAHISYADQAPDIDGLGSDWPGEVAVTFTTQHPSPAHANTMRVQLQWDEQFLYVYAEIEDDRLVRLSTDSTTRYLNDAVELYVDPLDDSGKRMDINDYQYIVDLTGASAVLKGEKSAILDSSKTAPKDLGIATVVFLCKTTQLLNAEDDTIGYAVEMAVPFTGMGALPHAGMAFKIDFCVDDADSLVDLATWPGNTHLPLFFCSNWEGYTDFSFPDHWRRFTLEGGPSAANRIGKSLLPYWLYIVLGLVVLSAVVIVWQARRIAQLKDVVPKTALNAAMVQSMLEQPNAKAPEAEGFDARPPFLPSDPEASTSETSDRPSAHKPLGIQHPIIARCRHFILGKLDQELRMEDLASECAVSLRQLQRIFKDEMNLSPGTFVVILKMERAAELLQSGQCNVSEAAWQLGFQDSSYFSRVFKKYHGVPPKNMLPS